jgi:hypothetical protein
MNRFFRTSPAIYESIRSAMDAESGFPNSHAETWFVPISSAPKDANGNPVIAAIAAIAARFEAAGAEEMSSTEYQNLLPQPEEEI